MATHFERATHAQVLDAYPRKTRRGVAWLLVGGIALLSILVLGVLAVLLTPSAPHACRFKCAPLPPPKLPGRQSIRDSSISTASGALPVVEGRTYTSSQYGYSVRWSPDLLPDPDKADNRTLDWQLATNAGQFSLTFTAGPAQSQSPQEIVNSIAQQFPDFQHVYDVPGAELGYQAGAGAVYNGDIIPPNGDSEHLRAIFTVAIKHGTAVAEVTIGPFQRDTGNGFADPAEMVNDQIADVLGNTVTWKGEPPL